MGDIIQEMLHHVPEGLVGNHVLLSALVAVPALNNGAAVQAILFFSLRNMGQSKYLLKNKYKKIQEAFLFRLHTVHASPGRRGASGTGIQPVCNSIV